MSDTRDSENEQSVEEILASIRKIISEEDGSVQTANAETVDEESADFDDILELSNPLPDEDDEKLGVSYEGGEATSINAQNKGNFNDGEKSKDSSSYVELHGNKGEEKVDLGEGLLSSSTAAISSAALAELTNVNNEQDRQAGQNSSVEDLVKELLRPMLKQWLDSNLPNMVEALVRQEIERIRSKND
jgi:cell pole-organizing protein PopZ